MAVKRIWLKRFFKFGMITAWVKIKIIEINFRFSPNFWSIIHLSLWRIRYSQIFISSISCGDMGFCVGRWSFLQRSFTFSIWNRTSRNWQYFKRFQQTRCYSTINRSCDRGIQHFCILNKTSMLFFLLFFIFHFYQSKHYTLIK